MIAFLAALGKAIGSTALAFGKGALGIASKSSPLAAGKWGVAAGQLGQGINKLAMANLATGQSSSRGSMQEDQQQQFSPSAQFQGINAPQSTAAPLVYQQNQGSPSLLLADEMRKRLDRGGY